MTTKHTPEPWKVSGIHVVAGPHIVCAMGESRKMWSANAPLIAAAPDQNSALRDLVRLHDEGFDRPEQFRLAWEAGRAAIAKAEPQP